MLIHVFARDAPYLASENAKPTGKYSNENALTRGDCVSLTWAEETGRMGDYIINFDPMKPKFEEKISEIFLLILQRIHNAAPGRSESSNTEKYCGEDKGQTCTYSLISDLL